MAQDPSEYWRGLESYSLSDPELEHENERDNCVSYEGEAETTEQETLDSDSNDDVPRWCREEIRLLKTKAGTSGAATRKRKSPASAQELPPPLKSNRRKSDSGDDKYDENDFREMKHLLQKLCKKVESNEGYLKEIQQKDRW